MRTEQRKTFESNLSKLNNCYSHYIFVWEQFSIDNQDRLEKQRESLTTEVFAKKINSKQFTVQLDYLTRSHSDAQNLIIKSIYLLVYGYFESYLVL